MNNIDVYGLGAALVDTEIEISDAVLEELNVEKGVMTLVDEERQASLLSQINSRANIVKRASGGSAANTIIAASYFGVSTHYSCRVANDEDGAFYLKDLSDAGVTFNPQVAQSNHPIPTGKCLVFVTPDAERTMNTFLGISEGLSEEQIDERALAHSRWVYIEGYLVTSSTGRPAAVKLRERAEALGVKTALSLSDPAMVQFFKEGLGEMIGEGVDLLFCNEAEALSFTDQKTLEDAAESLKKIAKTFAITRGAKGATLYDGSTFTNVDAHTVKAIDTNGAGDMFAGAFLSAISKGASFQEAGKLASKASSVVVSQFGPRLCAKQHQEILLSL